MISRRQFIISSALFPLLYSAIQSGQFLLVYAQNQNIDYHGTIGILKKAYWAEAAACTHYEHYAQKAMAENFPNIAYLFNALSSSENIHALNYLRLIEIFGASLEDKDLQVTLADTKTNLNKAAIKELKNIEVFYPQLLDGLSVESHDEAILNCMYSWKSHKQHVEMIRKIKKYSGVFFNSLSKKIEGMNLDYYVCEICGSTVNKEPVAPCDICNFSLKHYRRIVRPKKLK